LKDKKVSSERTISMKYKIKKLLRCENGVSIVIVALAMSVLFGFTALVFDVGSLLESKRRLQTVADAAALAGAQKFAETILNNGTTMEAEASAHNSAIEYITKNGIQEACTTISIDQQNKTVTVDVYEEQDLAFAPMIGFSKGRKEAHSKAVTGPIDSCEGMLPVFVTGGEKSGVVSLRQGLPPPDNPGNFYALALGGTGNQNYEEKLKFGYDGLICLGQELTTETGNKPQGTVNGLQYRIDKCTELHGGSCNALSYTPGCARIVTIPVCAGSPSGRDKVTVTGFVSLFIESVTMHGGEAVVNVTFINCITAGHVGGPDQTADYKTWGVNLID